MRRCLNLALFMIFMTQLLWASNLSSKSKTALSLYSEAERAFDPNKKKELLLQAVNKDKKFVEAYWQLAVIFQREGDVNKAIRLLEVCLKPKMPLFAKSQLRLANLLYNEGRYDDALSTAESIEDPIEIASKTEVIQNALFAIEQIQHPVEYTPELLENVSTIYDDYFPSISADESLISTTVLIKNRQQYYMQGQEDIFWSKKQNEQWTKSESVNEFLNTDANEGSQSFSPCGQYLFFVACNRREGKGSCDIYYSIRNGNKWSAPINAGAPLNSEFWESNPSLSANGKELYFVSNRQPNYGNRDIFVCDVRMNDDATLSFSNPRNVGAVINSEADEFSPFIHADNQTLYFASNRKPNMGKSDIYMSKRSNQGWSLPKNLGYPINTHRDEFGFVVNATGNTAYFAAENTTRDTGLDIYVMPLYEEAQPLKQQFIRGLVKDADTNKPLTAYVSIVNLSDASIYSATTSDKVLGEFTSYLPPQGSFALQVQKSGYLYFTQEINPNSETQVVLLQPIKTGSTMVLNNLFFGFDSDTIESNSFSTLNQLFKFLTLNPSVTIEIVGHTDNVGSEAYNRALSLKRAQAVSNALVKFGIKADRMIPKGKGNSMPRASNATEEGRAQNRRVEYHILTK